MNCPTYQEKITNKKYVYCPMCGSNLGGGYEVYSLDRLEYMLHKEKSGIFLYENFPAVKHCAIRQWKDVEDVRPTLGDENHVYLLNLRMISSMYSSPQIVQDLYCVGMFIGYLTVCE